MLIKNVKKEVHGLVFSDICPEDRQNFASFEKITSDRVLSALDKYVADSAATIMYLKHSRDFIRAFTDVELTPLDRVLMAWRTLYFFRAWLKWIQGHENQSVKYNINDNFISQNCFTCMEINAYGLLHLIKKFRDNNQSNLFLIGLFNSQTCEETFRQFRSLTPANWTKINFSLLELLHMVSRIELQNDIAYFKLSEIATLPRIHGQSNKHKQFTLPTDEELRNTLEQAIDEAVLDAAKFGMEIDPDQIRKCEISKGQIKHKKNDQGESSLNRVECIDQPAMMNCTYFCDYAEKVSDIDGNSRFLQICDEDGTAKVIRKSAIVNMLFESPRSLSKDRLERVKLSKDAVKNKRQIIQPECDLIYRSGLRISKEISIGQWCIYQMKRDETRQIIIGAILGFRYETGKNQKENQYSLDSVPVSYDGPNKRGLEVLALWYCLKDDFSLEILPVPSFFCNMNNYLATVEPPDCVFNKKEKCKLFNFPEISLSSERPYKS